MISYRVVRRLDFFKWKWRYYIQEYYCNYVDCGWDDVRELGFDEYKKYKRYIL
jgi:hypothetical protein